jgi:hypothetical protein
MITQQLNPLYWPIKIYSISLLVISYELYKEERSPSYGEIHPANIPPPMCEKSGLELGLAQVAGPLGNLAVKANWPATR